ncbi:MAG: sulfotransferase [Anaerolineales bacterium]|nr:sulfotransferase [Anaerolineales bacterium]MDW8447811.1 sulfotransferase [Anaerolineales bacterium]
MSKQLLLRLKSALLILLNKRPFIGREAAVLPPLSDEELAEIKRFFPMPKFFIFGHARSGTTLLARLVRLHPQVHCNWQAHFFTRPPFLTALVEDPAVREWLGRRSNRWNGGHNLSTPLLRVAADFILEREAVRLGKNIVGDKSPSSLVHGEAVQRAHLIYPDASLIYILRDGRDTVLSHRFQSFIDSIQHLSAQDLKLREEFARNPQPFLGGQKSVFTPSAFQRAVEEWLKNVEQTLALGRQLYGERFYVLRYEDLIADPWGEIQKVWRFLGAIEEAGLRESVELEVQANPDAEWQNQKASEIARALPKGKSEVWKQLLTPAEKEFFVKKAGYLLREWRYPLEG